MAAVNVYTCSCELYSAGSDSIWEGHRLLCPLMTTLLAKSWSQMSERPLQPADRHYVPPIILCGLSDVEGFYQKCLFRQERRQEHRD